MRSLLRWEGFPGNTLHSASGVLAAALKAKTCSNAPKVAQGYWIMEVNRQKA